MTYVDSQGVVLQNGIEAHIELEYDETTDMFVVTADPESCIDRFEDFRKKNYPNDDYSENYAEAREYCKKITGTYPTLRMVNYQLKEHCNPTDWYEFTWEYEDGTPVE